MPRRRQMRMLHENFPDKNGSQTSTTRRQLASNKLGVVIVTMHPSSGADETGTAGDAVSTTVGSESGGAAVAGVRDMVASPSTIATHSHTNNVNGSDGSTTSPATTIVLNGTEYHNGNHHNHNSNSKDDTAETTHVSFGLAKDKTEIAEPKPSQENGVSATGMESKNDENPRRRSMERRKKKLEERRLKLLNWKQSVQENYFSRSDYPVREWRFPLPYEMNLYPVIINPLVSFFAIFILWGLVIWSAVDSSNVLSMLLSWRTGIALHFTWFLQGSTAFFFFFIVYIAYRFGHIHLGQPSDVPEFSSAWYSMMIFTGGIGAGFFVFSVSQVLWSQHDHFYAQTGYRSQDEIDMFAMTITMATWGISGWTPYVVVAVCVSLAVHCFQLPMTLRSCFYPILGHYTWGWIGDCIDGLTIISSVSGITTSLGLGAIHIVTGFISLGWVDANSSRGQIVSIQNATIWVICVISTASVISGLHGGIRILANCAFVVTCVLWFLVLVMDDTKYVLNLIVQETGHYLQYGIFQLNFWTDAFGQLREGSGRAVDGKAAQQWWMDAWMVFYIAWWVTWAGFVGIFVASISKGRKLWEVVFYCLFAPIGYCLVWFCTLGGVGLRQSRQAQELQQLGLTYFNSSTHFLSSRSEFCYEVPQYDVYVNDQPVFMNHLLGVTPVCLFEDTKPETAAYNVLRSFRFPATFRGEGLGPMMSFLFVLASALICVTSCDSASLVVDNLASSGRKNNHWSRRTFWSLTVGAIATTLLSSGGEVALRAVQAASILCGLPFTFMLCYLLQSILLMCRAAEASSEHRSKYQFPNQPEFDVPVYGGIFNVFEYMASFGKVNIARVDRGMHQPTRRHVTEFMKGVLVPYVSLWQVLSTTYPKNRITNMCNVLCYMGCYWGWIVLLSTSGSHPGVQGIAWTLFFAAGGQLGWIRSGYRNKYNIRSNATADLFCSWFVWPQVLMQMQLQCVVSPLHNKNNSDNNSVADNQTSSTLTGREQPQQHEHPVVNHNHRPPGRRDAVTAANEEKEEMQ